MPKRKKNKSKGKEFENLRSLGYAQFALGAHDKAIPFLVESLELEPNQYQVCKLLAHIYNLRKEPIFAATYEERMREIGDNNTRK